MDVEYRSRCRQCGFVIEHAGEPAGFCSQGCYDVFEAIKASELNRAALDMKRMNE